MNSSKNALNEKSSKINKVENEVSELTKAKISSSKRVRVRRVKGSYQEKKVNVAKLDHKVDKSDKAVKIEIPANTEPSEFSKSFALKQGIALGDSLLRPKLRFVKNPNRVDLTKIFTFTIDSDQSQDLDDAISIKLLPDGVIKLYVHISDVAESITLDSPVDLEARARGTSIYLPGLVLPMFNFSISHDSLSLLPGKVRFALTLESDIDAEGNVLSTKIYKSSIKSNLRIDYVQVTDIIEGKQAGSELIFGKLSKNVLTSLQALHILSQRIGQQRLMRGGLNFEQFFTDFGAATNNEKIGHEIIERIMVLANEQAALWLEKNNSPAVYRVHPTFSKEDVENLCKLASSNGILLHLPGEVTPVVFAALLSQIKDHEAEQIILKFIQKIVSKAYYTIERSEHFGLGSKGYLHFTSPIRRYSDLINHRFIRNVLESKLLDSGDLKNNSVILRDFNLDTSIIDSLNSLSLYAVTMEKEATSGYQLSLITTPTSGVTGSLVYRNKDSFYFKTNITKVLGKVSHADAAVFLKINGKINLKKLYKFEIKNLDPLNNKFDLIFLK